MTQTSLKGKRSKENVRNASFNFFISQNIAVDPEWLHATGYRVRPLNKTSQVFKTESCVCKDQYNKRSNSLITILIF